MNTQENAEKSRDTKTATDADTPTAESRDSSPPNEPPPSKTGYPKEGAVD